MISTLLRNNTSILCTWNIEKKAKYGGQIWLISYIVLFAKRYMYQSENHNKQFKFYFWSGDLCFWYHYVFLYWNSNSIFGLIILAKRSWLKKKKALQYLDTLYKYHIFNHHSSWAKTLKHVSLDFLCWTMISFSYINQNITILSSLQMH